MRFLKNSFTLLVAILASVLLLGACQAKPTQGTISPEPGSQLTPKPLASQNDPTAIVSDFLASLKQDHSGNQSTIYLSQAMKADVANGHLLPTVVGIQDTYRSFGVSEALLDPSGKRAEVKATLNYVSPIRRDFLLVKEDGQWKINTIIAYAVPPMSVPENALPAANVILRYVDDLQAQDAHAAWSLLAPDAQTPFTEADIAQEATDIQQITATSMSLVEVNPARMVFEVTFWVTPSPNTTGDWKAGSNMRWFELKPTSEGWLIDTIANEPIG